MEPEGRALKETEGAARDSRREPGGERALGFTGERALGQRDGSRVK